MGLPLAREDRVRRNNACKKKSQVMGSPFADPIGDPEKDILVGGPKKD